MHTLEMHGCYWAIHNESQLIAHRHWQKLNAPVHRPGQVRILGRDFWLVDELRQSNHYRETGDTERRVCQAGTLVAGKKTELKAARFWDKGRFNNAWAIENALRHPAHRDIHSVAIMFTA